MDEINFHGNLHRNCENRKQLQKYKNGRADMKNWENNIRKVVPYVPGEQPKNQKVIKLNTNENPYPPSPKVAEVLSQMGTDTMRKYPDPAAQRLVEAIAADHHVSPRQVFPGVGSDDVLAMAFLTFFNSGKPILFPDITYSFYDVWADLFRIPYECQKLDDDFRIVKEDYFKENGGVIFPNPNAPTGALLPLDDIEEIIAHNRDVIVIVDEAYIDFGGISAETLIDKYDNLLIVQTFSKSRSMAGMRIGYALGNETLIGYLNDVKYSFNSYTMNETSILLGEAAVRDRAYFEETRRKIIGTRERVKEELRALGFSFPDSYANFLFVTHGEAPAKDLFASLKAEGIYVRYFNKPRIDNYLRITIGTDEEMDTLLAFLKNYLQKD
jgi:histidinol-phosphate aminotransferase